MFSTVENTINLSEVLRAVEEFLKIDDVCNADFVLNIVIQTPEDVLHRDHSVTSSPGANPHTFPVFHRSVTGSAETLVPSGPYFVISDGLYEA